ncbi:MAG: serine/threonine protein kinase, partial [Deltaproteobacteria bacterium]|nr:serine/threonine protein kinase [Deltaproteobacteria bacterium]
MMDRDEGPILDGTYALERRVTWGGMGEIWRGTDLRSGQAVAIKRVPGHADDGSGSLGERLVREARAVAAIAHPNVVRHIAAGFDQEGSPYLVLEWLEGESLEDARRKGTLTLSEKVKIVRQTLKGLEICHRHGIVHRDVKPGNIFLVREGDDLTVKLIDFGLALMADDARRMTATGEIMGTLYYLSPEQAQGLDTGPATDLYSVGVVLYELLAGRPPFVAEKALAVLLKIVTETPPRLRQLDPDLPSWVETVVLRAMARAPKDRYPSAAAMERAIVHGPLGSTLLGQPSAPPLPPRLSQSEPGPLPSQSSFSSSEYRLVSLLCVQPQPGADKAFLQAEARPAVEGDNGILHRLLGGQLIGIYGLGGTAGDEALRAVRAGLKL